jgi:DNA-binding XRE family transcriptional regulator
MGINYTDEQTAFLVEKYQENPSMETVLLLAEKFDKTTKSIIGKLSREGVYKRAVYTSKSGEAPITKVELVSNIAETLGVEVESLVGLEKSPKTTLKTLELATGSKE